MATVRIGILGAARIAPGGVIKPARNLERSRGASGRGPGSQPRRQLCVEARHPDRARLVRALLADPEIDAIYNPLPNGLHAEWTIAALEAGKHVLCEKPFTANAKEAEEVAAVAARTGLVVMEAFHYRYHPLAQRMREIVESGELGTTKRVEDRAVLPAAQVLRHPLSVRSRRRCHHGRRFVHRAHRAPARMRGARRALGRSQAAHPRGRSCDARGVGVPERSHRSDHLLDVVDVVHPDVRPRDRRRAESCT